MKPTTRIILLAAVALVVCGAGNAGAQQCGECDEGTRPSCRSGGEPSCENGTWQCPVVVCDPTGPQVCRDECGTWDSELCECYNIPPFCRGPQCDEHHRWECEWDGGRWNDDWCYCEYIYEDGLRGRAGAAGNAGPPRPGVKPREIPLPEIRLRGSRTERFGHFAPVANSCEGDQKIPTSLAMALGDVRLHNGGPLTDHSGELKPHVWGTSRLVLWGVRDQNTALFRRGDMFATEWVTQIGGQPASINLDRTVSVPDGVFGDIYALVRENPPTLQPGEYSLIRQIISIHWNGSEWYEVLRHCVKVTHNDVITGVPCN